MRENIRVICQLLSEFSEVSILYEYDKIIEDCSVMVQSNSPLMESCKLRNILKEKIEVQTIPVIYQCIADIYFGCIKDTINQGCYLYYGPITMMPPNNLQISRFKKEYKMNRDTSFSISCLSYTKMLTLTEILYYEVTGKNVPREQLINKNNFCNDLQQNLSEKQLFFHLNQQKAPPHHTYQEECKLLSYVKDGQGEKAIAQSMMMDAIIPPLAHHNQIEHYRKLVVAAITLCTRASITSGFSPTQAYQISDYYLNKLDECNSVPVLIECRNRAIWEICENVKNRLGNRPSSKIEQAKDYIAKHIEEKIRVSEIASGLCISESCLSREFSLHEGCSIQQYIIKYRIQEAANLLQYTSRSVTQISEQFNFSNPSFFCKEFKKYMCMTPKQYRKTFAPAEFSENLSV